MSLRGLLTLVIVAELAITAGAIVWQVRKPSPPQFNAARLDAGTAADFQSLREAAGDAPAVWQELGEAFLAYGYFPESEACLRRTAQLQPGSFQTLYAWAYALQRLGRLDEAIDRFSQAADLAPPEMADACWYHIGRCHLRREDIEAAEKAFARASEFAPAEYQIAKLRVRSGRAAQATEILDSLLEPPVPDLQPLLLRAAAERMQGRPEVARELTRRAERATGKLPLTDHHQFLNPIRFRYGLSRQVARYADMRSRGLREDAARGYREMMSQMDFWDRRRMAPMLAALELELDQPQAAETVLRDLFEHSSITPDTLMLLGDAQARQQRPQEARETYERALRMRPGFLLHSRLTRIHEQTGDAELARHHAARAFCHQGIDAFREDRLEDATSSLREAVRLDPQQPQAWFYLGESLQAMGNTTEAVAAYQRCVELNPTHGRALTMLASAVADVPLSSDAAQ